MTPLYMIIASQPRWEERRCCDDRPPPAVRRARPLWPLRWARKSAIAIPAATRVFRRQMAQPAATPIVAGTPVVTTSGRHLGLVRDRVVGLGSGTTSYAVADGERTGEGRVLLLPGRSVRPEGDIAIIDDRIVRTLERRGA